MKKKQEKKRKMMNKVKIKTHKKIGELKEKLKK